MQGVLSILCPGNVVAPAVLAIDNMTISVSLNLLDLQLSLEVGVCGPRQYPLRYQNTGSCF